MARCPVCGEHVDRPASSVMKAESLLPEEVADASREVYVQMECPACEAIMGYLGVAAAAAKADDPDLEVTSRSGKTSDEESADAPDREGSTGTPGDDAGDAPTGGFETGDDDADDAGAESGDDDERRKWDPEADDE